MRRAQPCSASSYSLADSARSAARCEFTNWATSAVVAWIARSRASRLGPRCSKDSSGRRRHHLRSTEVAQARPRVGAEPLIRAAKTNGRRHCTRDGRSVDASSVDLNRPAWSGVSRARRLGRSGAAGVDRAARAFGLATSRALAKHPQGDDVRTLTGGVAGAVGSLVRMGFGPLGCAEPNMGVSCRKIRSRALRPQLSTVVRVTRFPSGPLARARRRKVREEWQNAAAVPSLGSSATASALQRTIRTAS